MNDDICEEAEEDEEKDECEIRRVKIQSLDIDWLFYEDNFNTTLEILSETD